MAAGAATLTNCLLRGPWEPEDGDLPDAPQLEGETMSVIPLPLEMRARSSRKGLLILCWVFLMV